MKRTLFSVSAAFLSTILSFSLFAQTNGHHVYRDVENKAIDFMTTNQYLLSGNMRPAFVNGWVNNAGAGNIQRIQFHLLNNNLNTVIVKTYVANDEKTLVEKGRCPHLSTTFEAEYGKQIAGGDFIYCGQVFRSPESAGSCGGDYYSDVFLLRLNSTGAPIWYKRYQITGELRSVVQTSDGGFMACGYQRSVSSAYHKALILKTDAMGNVQWTKLIDGQSYWDPNVYLSSEYHQIINYQSNSCALVGSSFFGKTNTIVTIIDNAGNITQNVNYNSAAQPNGDDNTLYGTSICTTSDDKLAVCGTGGQQCVDGAKLMVMKIDPATMNLDFLKFYYPSGNSLYDATGTNIKCVDTRLCVTGKDYTNSAGLYAETDLSGNLLRYALFGPVDYTVGRFITVNTTLGVPVISGSTATNETFVIRNDINVDCQATDVQRDEYNMTYDKLTPQGEEMVVSMVDDQLFVYDMFFSELTICEPPPAPFQEGTMSVPGLLNASDQRVTVYPNPSSGTVIIHHVNGLAVSYEIYDVLGKKVRSGTADKDQPVDVSALDKGVYIIRVQDADGVINAIRLSKE